METRVWSIINDLEKEFIELSDSILENPELGNDEFYACRQHIDILKKHGFSIEENYMDQKTGFRAEYDSEKEGPTIAYLSEYDALPGIGHGCGHNILGTVSTGSGIVLKEIIDEIGGRVVVFGTPAEETSGAKVIYADNGAFEDVDIALVAHPNSEYNESGTSLAMEAIQFEFKGKTAHAAASPEKGINALDAVINTFTSINALRQQTKPDARIHGIITEGGKAPNIIPDKCIAQFYVRAATKTYLTELVEKVKNCARGASLAAGTQLEISNFELSYDNLVTNRTLSELFTGNLRKAGVTEINESRKAFGSLDAGNVSHICPTIHPYFDITNNREMAVHTVEFRDSTKTDFAYDNMKKTINAMVFTAIDVIKDKDIQARIREEFELAEK